MIENEPKTTLVFSTHLLTASLFVDFVNFTMASDGGFSTTCL